MLFSNSSKNISMTCKREMFYFENSVCGFRQCWSPDIRINRNPDIFGPFNRPKIDAPNSDTRIVKKTLFLEHFFMIFTFCMVVNIFLLRIVFLFWFLYSFYCTKKLPKWKKIFLRKLGRMMRYIMMKMMRKMMKIMTI